jgi:hypothetical protein
MNDDDGDRPRDLDLDAHRFVEKNEKEEEEEIVLVHKAGGTVVSLTHSTTTGTSGKQRARQQYLRRTRIFTFLLSFIYIVEITYCPSTGGSTAASCDRFPFALLTFLSCGWISPAEWFCFLIVLFKKRSSIWNSFVKYGYQYHIFDYKIVQRTTRIANQIASIWNTFVKHIFDYKIVQQTTRIVNQIAKKIRRSVGTHTSRLVRKTLRAFRYFLFVLINLLLFMGLLLLGATVTFVVLSVQAVLEIAIRVLLRFQFAIKPTVWLVCTILHF